MEICQRQIWVLGRSPESRPLRYGGHAPARRNWTQILRHSSVLGISNGGQVYADYKGKGAVVVAITPNDPNAVRLDELGYSDLGDSFEETKLRAKEKRFEFPYLYDGENQKVPPAYGPVLTPHVFIRLRSRRSDGGTTGSARGAPLCLLQAEKRRNTMDTLPSELFSCGARFTGSGKRRVSTNKPGIGFWAADKLADFRWKSGCHFGPWKCL